MRIYLRLRHLCLFRVQTGWTGKVLECYHDHEELKMEALVRISSSCHRVDRGWRAQT
jgi:hypothetical protein